MTNGLHTNLAPETYFGLENRVSKSVLMAHRLSPAHALHTMHKSTDQTPSMRLGSLVHTLILEPEKLASRYAVGPEAARNTKEWKEWAANQDEKLELLKVSEFEEARAMTAWLDTKPTIARLINGPGPVEASILWTETDAITGIAIDFRGRPDKIRTDLEVLIDIKTTADISDRAIERTIHAFGYHLQMELYMQGLKAVGAPVSHAVIVFIENKAPHDARAILLDESWLEAARTELVTLKAKHAEALATTKWPGFPDAIVDSSAPTWLVKPFEVAA
jgi:hypothetical protein